MASKQLGKLRQWAGEKISSEKKTIATDAFKDMEVEVERRRTGMEQLYESSQAYYRYLVRKKETGEPEQKQLPMEMFGNIMVAHGEEFGSDSAYGHSLCTLGKAHIDVAHQQELFADSFHSGFLTRVEASLAEVAQYHLLRKKLKSRRLAYDAAISQAQKQFKKEKEKNDAEEEVTKARARFEEISAEVQSQMEKIQDGEMDQFKDLGHLLDMELKFAESWVSALREVKAVWPDDADVYRVTPNRPRGPTHVMRPTTPASIPNTVAEGQLESDTSDSGRRSTQHRHSTSVVTPGSQGRKSSVSNWASSFLRKDKSGEFTELNGDDTLNHGSPIARTPPDAPTPLTRTRSGRAAPPPPRSRAHSSLSESYPERRNSPRQLSRNLPPGDKFQKIMRALYAFTGGEDELPMEVGDEITVLAEPSDSWWMGECKGMKGLFPVNYTEEVPKKPPLPARPSALARTGHSQPSSPVHEFPVLRSRSNSANITRTQWKDEPFGDHHSALSPVLPSPDYRQTTHNRPNEDNDSDIEERGLVDKGDRPVTNGENEGRNVIASSHAGVMRQLSRSLSGKKAPPPPPPSRRTNSTSINRLSSSVSNSATASPFLTPKTANADWGSAQISATDSKSPFEEGDHYGIADELDVGSISSMSISQQKCRVCNCDDFQQSLFRTDGYCNSCFHLHTQ